MAFFHFIGATYDFLSACKLYFSHVDSFPWEWTRASKSNSHKRQHALIDLAFCYRHCFNKALAFFLEMSVNDTQHLIWKISLTTTDLAFCPGSKLAFVPVLEPGQGFRDKSLSRLLSRVEEPGQKVSDVKKIFAHHGIRSQDLLPNAWFPCQFT